mmetsp:Transcript_5666/g.13756  ORF Transcript_5666/g.13756 Transcript_5666/m.13756 type:complete len:248 (+) Transcript_5666:922-1665(+)
MRLAQALGLRATTASAAGHRGVMSGSKLESGAGAGSGTEPGVPRGRTPASAGWTSSSSGATESKGNPGPDLVDLRPGPRLRGEAPLCSRSRPWFRPDANAEAKDAARSLAAANTPVVVEDAPPAMLGAAGVPTPGRPVAVPDHRAWCTTPCAAPPTSRAARAASDKSCALARATSGLGAGFVHRAWQGSLGLPLSEQARGSGASASSCESFVPSPPPDCGRCRGERRGRGAVAPLGGDGGLGVGDKG